MRKRILILPKAGPHNPFQYQLITFLQENKYQTCTFESKNGWAILKAVRLCKPDIVYFDWIQSYVLSRYLLLTLVKCLLFWIQIQYLYYIHKVPFVHTLHNLKNHAGVWPQIEQLMFRFFLPKCRFVRVYSETTKQKIVETYKLNSEQVRVIQDVPFHFHYPNQVSQEDARAFLNIPTQCFVYAFFGLVKPYKGLETLVESFKQVATSNDYLIIAGPEEHPRYTDQIRQLAKNHPHILMYIEFLPKEKVQYFINAADIMVLPFKSVEHSGSVDLCMSFKKPVITRRTPLLLEQLSNQGHLLFDDYEELIQRMAQAKSLPLQAIGIQNYEKANNVNYQELINLFV